MDGYRNVHSTAQGGLVIPLTLNSKTASEFSLTSTWNGLPLDLCPDPSGESLQRLKSSSFPEAGLSGGCDSHALWKCLFAVLSQILLPVAATMLSIHGF